MDIFVKTQTKNWLLCSKPVNFDVKFAGICFYLGGDSYSQIGENGTHGKIAKNAYVYLFLPFH